MRRTAVFSVSAIIVAALQVRAGVGYGAAPAAYGPGATYMSSAAPIPRSSVLNQAVLPPRTVVMTSTVSTVETIYSTLTSTITETAVSTATETVSATETVTNCPVASPAAIPSSSVLNNVVTPEILPASSSSCTTTPTPEPSSTVLNIVASSTPCTTSTSAAAGAMATNGPDTKMHDGSPSKDSVPAADPSGSATLASVNAEPSPTDSGDKVADGEKTLAYNSLNGQSASSSAHPATSTLSVALAGFAASLFLLVLV